jgi:hypothetical protein
MIATLRDFEPLIVTFPGRSVHEAMLAGNAPGPPPLQCVLKGLRLAGPLKRIALTIFDQVVDVPYDPGIGLLPVEIVFPCTAGPKKLHGAWAGF